MFNQNSGPPPTYPPFPYPSGDGSLLPQQQQWQSPIPSSTAISPLQPQPSQGSSWYMQPSPNQVGSASYSGMPQSSPTMSHNFTPPQRSASGSLRETESQQRQEQPKNGAGKKKRRKGVEDGSPNGADGDKDGKRTKTGRACDACRTKKIRCDILPSDNDDREPICAHCKQSGLECTFFLPITETRFKKKKAAEEEARFSQSHSPATGALVETKQEIPVRTEGPTSLSFLIHTSLPASASEAYDLRAHNRWEVSEDGNGLIRVNAPPTGGQAHADADPDDPTRAHNRLNKPVLSAQTISLLVNAYFDHLAPLFPIISRQEFTSKSSPSPLLLYSICGLGATRRQFPREVFSGVRGVINGLLRSNDILSDARFENVQALLLISQVGDLHAQPTAATASAALIRTGTATRMAQDLGLHRESTLRAQNAHDLAYVELRRRVWATCVILDRWYGAALGIPLLIDLLDCDVLLPAPYEILPDAEPGSWPIDESFMALAEHLKLSILVGRVLKTIYSPTGLKHTTDDQLESLLRDMTGWIDGLPEQLVFKGNDSGMAAGLLHMSHAAVQFLFWRVFMRIQYTCPAHISFGLNPAAWTRMVQWSAESIEWLSHNDEALDSLFVYPYTGTSCALIQYHNWARRKDAKSLEWLRVIKETAIKWEKQVQPDQMSIRRKTCETMTLLYEAALKTHSSDPNEPARPPPNINPTAGVRPRPEVGKAVWVPDASLASGGIWVARSEEEKREAGVRSHNVLLLEELKARRGAGALEVTPGALTTNNGAAEGNVVPMQMHQASQPQQQQHEQEMQALADVQSATNLNPQLNLDLTGVSSVPPGDYAGNPMDGGLDLSLLDGLPMSGFDFPSWEAYFSGMNAGQTMYGYGGGMS